MHKKSIKISNHATSISLEPEFWTVLEEAAKDLNKSIPQLVAAIDKDRGESNLSSSLRVFALKHVLQKLI